MMENESRIAEREARKWVLTREIISKQSAREIASWWHCGGITNSIAMSSTGFVAPDLTRDDFLSDEEYAELEDLDKDCMDALMAYVCIEKSIRHSDYPHTYGTLYDCPECEACCHCDDTLETCVRCAMDEMELCGCAPDGSHFCHEHQVAIERFCRD